MAIIGINYDGCNTYDEVSGEVISSSFEYESVTLSTRDEKFIFQTGNLVKDWFDVNKKYTEIQDKEPFCSYSSSINHFQADGGKFDSAYLHIIDNKPVLLYVNHDSPDTVWEDGIEFFVHEGTRPTWEELKEMCK